MQIDVLEVEGVYYGMLLSLFSTNSYYSLYFFLTNHWRVLVESSEEKRRLKSFVSEYYSHTYAFRIIANDFVMVW